MDATESETLITLAEHRRLVDLAIAVERSRCSELANAMYDLMEASHPQMAELLRQIESGEPNPA